MYEHCKEGVLFPNTYHKGGQNMPPIDLLFMSLKLNNLDIII